MVSLYIRGVRDVHVRGHVFHSGPSDGGARRRVKIVSRLLAFSCVSNRRQRNTPADRRGGYGGPTVVVSFATTINWADGTSNRIIDKQSTAIGTHCRLI